MLLYLQQSVIFITTNEHVLTQYATWHKTKQKVRTAKAVYAILCVHS